VFVHDEVTRDVARSSRQMLSGLKILKHNLFVILGLDRVDCWLKLTDDVLWPTWWSAFVQ